MLYASPHPLHKAAPCSTSTSGPKPAFKTDSSFQGPLPSAGHVAKDESLHSSTFPVSLLGCEAGMARRAFPTLKLNAVCLFLERLSGSSPAHGNPSACHGAGEVGEQFYNYRGLCELEDYCYDSADTRCPGKMQGLNIETPCRLLPKLKAGMLKRAETLTMGATENAGSVGVQ